VTLELDEHKTEVIRKYSSEVGAERQDVVCEHEMVFVQHRPDDVKEPSGCMLGPRGSIAKRVLGWPLMARKLLCTIST